MGRSSEWPSIPGGVGAPNRPAPITLMDTSQNPPGVSCLVHSGQVAKQHESSFLYDSREGGCSVIRLTTDHSGIIKDFRLAQIDDFIGLESIWSNTRANATICDLTRPA